MAFSPNDRISTTNLIEGAIKYSQSLTTWTSPTFIRQSYPAAPRQAIRTSGLRSEIGVKSSGESSVPIPQAVENAVELRCMDFH